MNGLRKITWAGLLAAAILFTAHGSTEGGGLTGSGSVFTTPAQYREMVLATPSVGGNVTITSNVTITGNNAYNAGDNDTLFPSGRTVTLSPFKIAKYETTYELWYEVKQWA
ncbi:MAG: formylglycine-generating enzyme family protein, partial [Spirochaetaceae bacterium]|nr:formylglycine-generating enzyme family protein [Spirochaetaceae bacterium]